MFIPTFENEMKKIVGFIMFLCSFSAYSQQGDTNYTNIYTRVSDYRNYNEVYLSNLGQAKFNLLNPFDDNNPKVKLLFPTQNKTGTYTDIFYTLGSGKENYFNLEHTQQLGENFFGKATLLKTNSLGMYRFQQADLSDFNVNLRYDNKQSRYSFEVNFDNYKRSNEINGGIADSVFFALQDSSNANVKTTYPVRLTNFQGATPNLLDIKVMDLNLSHQLALTKEKNDSIGYFRLAQSLNYNRIKQSYSIVDYSNFYDTSFYDTTQTNDSLRLEQMSHTMGVEFLKNNIVLGVGLGQNYYEYNSYSPFTTHLENFLYADLIYKNSKLMIKSSAQFLTSQGKYESHYFKNSIHYQDDSLPIFQQFKALLNYETDLPELYYNQYLSNHFKWTTINKLNTLIKASFTAKNLVKKVSVGINFESQSRAIYFDTNSQLGQASISLLGFSFEKEFRLTNWLFWSTHLHFQDILTEQAIEVPNFVTYNKIYGRGRIIKKVLAFEAGINVLYYSRFNSRAYNPAIDQFYVQTNQSVGNYPFIDVFTEFYLKNSFAFFITVTHVNSNLLTSLTGNNYLATTQYPSQDRAFKFGFKWRLFD